MTVRGHSSLPGAVGEDIRYEVTVGPDEFDQDVDFDIGVGAFYLIATLLDVDTDGETLGLDPGELAITVGYVQTEATLDLMDAHSMNAGVLGSGWVQDTPWIGNDPLPVVTQRSAGMSIGLLRVSFNIFDGDSAEPYAGPNHPTATWRVDIVRR